MLSITILFENLAREVGYMTKQNMLPAPPKMVTFSLTIEEGEQAKLMVFINSDSWERAEKLRKAISLWDMEKKCND